MAQYKKVIITLPKGLARASPGLLTCGDQHKELSGSAPRLNFTNSVLLPDKKLSSQELDLILPAVNGILIKREQLEDESQDSQQLSQQKPKGKKRKLDYLTWEQKLQRKKLKNREAAQTSRDRKKARLEELEETLKTLKKQNEILAQECQTLKSQNESLKQRTPKATESSNSICRMCQARVNCEALTLGSAVSPNDPLQQGGAVQKARPVTQMTFKALLMAFLLSSPCLANSKTLMGSRRCFESLLKPETRQILSRIASKRPGSGKKRQLQKRWWGRHQKSWRPLNPSKSKI